MDFSTFPSCSMFRHIRIFQQKPFGFFIEQLGRNVSWLNGQRLSKGDVRTLQQGDEISVLNPPRADLDSEEHRPFAVFVFRLIESGQLRAPKRLKLMEGIQGIQGIDPGATLAAPGGEDVDNNIDGSELSAEKDFQKNYDMRIDTNTLIGKVEQGWEICTWHSKHEKTGFILT